MASYWSNDGEKHVQHLLIRVLNGSKRVDGRERKRERERSNATQSVDERQEGLRDKEL